MEQLFEKMFNFLLRLLVDKPYFSVAFLVLIVVYLLSNVLKKCSCNGSAGNLAIRRNLRIGFLSVEYDSKWLETGMEKLSNWMLAGRTATDRDVIGYVIDCTSMFIVAAQFLVSVLFAVSTFMHVSYWTSQLCHWMMSHSRVHTSPSSSPPPPSLLEVNFILPGLGTGTDSFLEYLPIFIVVSLVHEFGHYFASMLNAIRPLAVQFKFMYFVPLTSVQLDFPSYSKLPKRKKLGIVTSGIFANFLLCLAVQIAMILVTKFGLYENRGVTVWRILDDNHPIVGQPGTGTNGLQLNDRIEKISGCLTGNVANYYRCLHDISRSAPIGVCVSEPLRFDVDMGPEPEPEPEPRLSPIPFIIDIVPVLPECSHRLEIYVYNATDSRRRTCVNLRRLVRNEQKKRDRSLRYCRQQTDCAADNNNNADYCLIADAEYAAAAFASEIADNRFEQFRIFFIERNSDPSQLIIFVGVISDFSHTVYVVQRNVLLEFLRKFYEISLSFGFFNLLPCFNFDGYLLLFELVGFLRLNRTCKFGLVRFVSRSIAAFVLLHLAVSLWWAKVPEP